MKMLIMPTYFFPEQVSSTHLDIDRFDAYSRNNIESVVITPQPTRGIDKTIRQETPMKEQLFSGTVTVHRFRMFREGRNPLIRALRYSMVQLCQYYFGRKETGIDVIYSGSTPPTQGLLCGRLKQRLIRKKGKYVPYILCLQDLFPESLVNAGITQKGSILWRIGERVEKYTYNAADKIIVICNQFKRSLMEKGVSEDKIKVISNWIDLDTIKPVKREDNGLIKEYNLDKNKFLIVYAGNLGETQGSDIIIRVAKRLQNYVDIHFVIFGAGVCFSDIQTQAQDLSNVTVGNILPLERISEVYSLGNIDLITCKKGTGKAGLPSKVWSIMACNTCIVASFDTDSDLAEILDRSNAGVCVEPENELALQQAILEKYEAWKSDKSSYVDSRKFVAQYASRDACVEQYCQLIRSSVK